MCRRWKCCAGWIFSKINSKKIIKREKLQKLINVQEVIRLCRWEIFKKLIICAALLLDTLEYLRTIHIFCRTWHWSKEYFQIYIFFLRFLAIKQAFLDCSSLSFLVQCKTFVCNSHLLGDLRLIELKSGQPNEPKRVSKFPFLGASNSMIWWRKREKG